MSSDLQDHHAKGKAAERRLYECPKCGARGGCPKHGLSNTGIDLRARGLQ